jgi:peptide/nickel transport system ATP-binding protein
VTADPLLRVTDLRVTFATRNGPVEALHGISLDLAAGGTLGVVGESGSGKSVTAFAITGLLDRAGRITGGAVAFRGQDITRASRKGLRSLRGAAMSMVFQNPRAALNPIRCVGRQIMDAVLAHADLSKAAARDRAMELLNAVMIRDPAQRFDAYPHELSGGMCQRVMIAMAIACAPDLLIADEPTTGLDVTTQKTVMDLLARLTADRGMAMMLITHDLGLAARYCRDITVMEGGLVVESGETVSLFRTPAQSYTRRLIAASPTPHSTIADLALATGEKVAPAQPRHVEKPPRGTPVMLELKQVEKRYGTLITAVDRVSFKLASGGSLGLVGESGSGKTTLSRLICRLIDCTAGDILFDGASIADIPARHFHHAKQRREIQIVFQDPHDSLNPRFTAFDSIAHPLRRMDHLRDGATLRARVHEAAERAGLPFDLLQRFPHQLSGGQKARIGIARAIAIRPRLLVLDEPTAALDVSVQAVILALLDRLRREDQLAFLFVSHDLNVVRMMCENTVVLRNGRIVEIGVSQEIFNHPASPYTRDLLAAIPHFDPDAPRYLDTELMSATA